MMSLENLLTEANTFTEHFFPNNSEPSIYDRVTSDTWIQNRLTSLNKLKKDGLYYFKKIIAAKGDVNEEKLNAAKEAFLKLPLEEQNERIKKEGEEEEKALKKLHENENKIAELERQLEVEKAKEGKSSTSVTTLNEATDRILPAPCNN